MLTEAQKGGIRKRVDEGGILDLWSFTRSKVISGSNEQNPMALDAMGYGLQYHESKWSTKLEPLQAILNEVNQLKEAIADQAVAITTTMATPMQQPQMHMEGGARTLANYDGVIMLSNPLTGEVKVFSGTTTFKAFLFGPLQLMHHGIWNHFFFSTGFGMLCTFKNKELIINHYLSQGYVQTKG